MKNLEIIKKWNETKKAKFPCKNGDELSSIAKRIDSLIEKFGEELVEEYFDSMMNSYNTSVDIWLYADMLKIDNYRKEKINKEKEVEKKNDLNILNILSGQIVSLMGKELADKISAEVENKINKFVEDKVLTKVFEYKGEPKKVEGIAHEQLETIVKFVAMDEPVIMVGPAGTGKNVIAKQVADALGLDFYFSNAVTQEYKITGYGDANGEFVKTQFFDAFTKGGLFLLDEVDASCPEALIVLNCAIANGYFDFPVLGRMNAHENFRVIACANTYGTGASMEYVGRNQLDGATLNRFAIVEVDYDKRIEDSVCPDKELANFCRDFRNVCEKNGVHHIVSYREMKRLYKMIYGASLDKEVALKTCLLKGLEKDTLRMIENKMKNNEYKNILKKISE